MKKPATLLSTALLPLLLIGFVQADTFTFTGLTGSQNFSDGPGWDAAPVSALDTILTYSGTLDADAIVGSVNDAGNPFLLNRINFNYAGPASGTAPVVTLSGSPMEFTGASAQIRVTTTGTVRPQLNVANDLVLSSDLSVFNGTTQPVILSGAITGTGGLSFLDIGSNNTAFRLSNPGNDYAGDTRIHYSSSSGRSHTLFLDAANVIPSGPGRGNLVLSSPGEAAGVTVDLNGFDQTVNGLMSALSGNTSTTSMTVRNNGASPVILTVGENDASGSFAGALVNGTGGLSLVKKGSGTQVLAGTTTYTGSTTVSDGTLKVDYTLFGTSKTTNPSNNFGSSSAVILDGGTTFAIEGRGDGGAIEQQSVSLGQYSATLTLSNANASQLVVGQELFFEKTGGAGTPSTDVYILYMTDNGNGTTTVRANKRLGGTGGSIVTVTSNASPGSTFQSLASLTLSGAADENVTLDFGTSNSVVLQINSAPVQVNDGSTLTIANWGGLLGGGGAERLMFLGTPTDFTSVFSQSEVIFSGHGPGYQVFAGVGEYEITAIPEPASLLLFFIAGGALLALRRRR